MPQLENAPAIPGFQPGRKALLVFFETDCPTCQLALPYLNALGDSLQVIGISQDDEQSTREFVRQLQIGYRVELDRGLKLSRAYDPQSVPTMVLLDESGRIARTLVGFDKKGLNELAAAVGHAPIAPMDDGAPSWKPGCSSRHLHPSQPESGCLGTPDLEPETQSTEQGSASYFLRRTAKPASRITLRDDEDPFE